MHGCFSFIEFLFQSHYWTIGKLLNNREPNKPNKTLNHWCLSTSQSQSPFMETGMPQCHNTTEKQCLGVEPHIYHSTEHKWRHTLVMASLKLLATLKKKTLYQNHWWRKSKAGTKNRWKVKPIWNKRNTNTDTETFKNCSWEFMKQNN